MNIKTKKLPLHGFTLMELLFVIAIISVIAMAGMSFVQQRAQETKIEKSVLQIQQLLQAGMAYYIDNGCWPIKGAPQPPGCKAVNPPPFEGDNGYIPVGGTVNPWNKTYSWGRTNNLFWVAVDSTSDSIAQRIAGKLPNATTQKTTQDCTATTTDSCVYAQTTIPAQVSGNPPIFVAAHGFLKYITFLQDTTTDPNWYYAQSQKTSPAVNNCPPGYSPGIDVTTGAYEFVDNAGNNPTPQFPLAIYPVARLSSSSQPSSTFYYNLSVWARTVECKFSCNFFHTSCHMNCEIKSPPISLDLEYTIYCCSNRLQKSGAPFCKEPPVPSMPPD